MAEINPERIKALRWESSAGVAGVAVYEVDDAGCPRNAIINVEMTPAEMVDLAFDLLNTARVMGDLGATYLARQTYPTVLTPEDEEAILALLRDREPPPEHEECC